MPRIEWDGGFLWKPSVPWWNDGICHQHFWKIWVTEDTEIGEIMELYSITESVVIGLNIRTSCKPLLKARIVVSEWVLYYRFKKWKQVPLQTIFFFFYSTVIDKSTKASFCISYGCFIFTTFSHIFSQSIYCLMQYCCNNINDLYALSLSMSLAVQHLITV